MHMESLHSTGQAAVYETEDYRFKSDLLHTWGRSLINEETAFLTYICILKNLYMHMKCLHSL